MSPTPSDRIKFNVGGTLFETTRGTIDKLGSDFFSRLLDPNSGFNQPDDNVYFIDRDPDCFRIILNIARYNEIFMTSNANIEMLETEADFFCLSERCRSIISVYKNDPKNRCVVSLLTPDLQKGGLCVTLNMSSEEYASKDNILQHHACLCKEIEVPGYSLRCQLNSSCPEIFIRHRDFLRCCRCLQEIDLKSLRRDVLDWCHKCRRCLKCTETFCVLLKQ